MGGSIGAAVFGAVLSSRLAHYLSEELGRAGIRPGSGGAAVKANDVQAIQHLAEPVKGLVLRTFTDALNNVFMVGVPFLVLAFVVSLFLKEIPLRTAQGPGGPGGRQAGPAEPGPGAPAEVPAPTFGD